MEIELDKLVKVDYNRMAQQAKNTTKFIAIGKITQLENNGNEGFIKVLTILEDPNNFNWTLVYFDPETLKLLYSQESHENEN